MQKIIPALLVIAVSVFRLSTANVSEAFAQEEKSERRHSEIWLAPQSLPPPPLSQDADFLEMFTPHAPWEFAASHTDVFKLYGSYLGHATQEQVNIVVADLKRRHIDIAVEVGVLNVNFNPPPPCGGLGIIEGYGTPAQAKHISDMIKAAGGSIKYLVMDEPLYHGHFSSQPHACHSPIEVMIQQVVPTLSAYIQEFPDIIVGEVEPTRFPAYDNWQADILTWINGFKTTMGRPLAFMQLDIPWTDDNQLVPGASRPSMEPGDALTFYRYVRELMHHGLVGKIGIINDGTPKDTTDAAWTEDARDHVRLLEEKYGLRPDQDIFQSWMPHPAHALPEWQSDTLTGLIVWYFISGIEGLRR
jgi:hypothetical protein